MKNLSFVVAFGVVTLTADRFFEGSKCLCMQLMSCGHFINSTSMYSYQAILVYLCITNAENTIRMPLLYVMGTQHRNENEQKNHWQIRSSLRFLDDAD